jgi:hypothetical protein
MNTIKLSAETLKKLASLVKDPAQTLPEALKLLAPNGRWNLLTQKVGSNLAKTDETELTLPLLDQSATTGGAIASDWTWTASIEANASLTMDLLSIDDLKHLPIQPDVGHTLIAYGATLSAGTKAGANANQLPWGKAGIKADGKRSVGLHWYVQAKDDATLLASLESAQSHFIWPHDIQGMLRLAQRTDWFGLAYELDGEAQLAIDIEASAQGPGWTFSMNGETSSVGLSFGIKAGFKAAHTSRWKLSTMVEARTQPGGATVLGLRVKLHDLQQRKRNASIALTAGADFSAVASSAERALRAAWPELQKSKELDALTQPGTAILDGLRDLIDSKLDGSLQALAKVLIGGEPATSMPDDLVNKLTFGLADVLDGALGDLASGQANVDNAVAAWLDQLLGKAAAFVTVDDQIKMLVSEALVKATEGLNAAIDTLKTQVVGKAQVEVDAVLKRLGELGAQFEKKLQHLDDNAASTAIRNALKTYADLRSKLLGVLADSHRQKLTLTLAALYAQETMVEAAFEAWFRPDDAVTPEAQRLFSALHGGQLLALPELAQAAASMGAVADAKGWLLSASKTLQEQRVTLNFFGIQIASGSTWLREVVVKSDLVTGNLLAVKASVVGETTILNPWKNRSARLGLQLDLSGVGTFKQLSVSLDGAFTAKNENTSQATVQDLLNSYADATGAQRSDIGLVLDLPPTSDSDGTRKFWKALTIAVPVALDAQQWAKFAALDPSQIESASLEIALAQFQRRYVTDSLFSNDPIGDLRELIMAQTGAKLASDVAILKYLKLFPEGYVNRPSANELEEKYNIGARDSDLHSRGYMHFKAYHRLSATVQAPMRLRNLSAQAASLLQGLPEHPDPVAVRKLLEPIMVKMQIALAPVALVSETLLGIGIGGAKDESVTWPFASFITSMAKLAGLPVPPGFVPVAQVGDQLPVRLLAG